MTTAADAMRNRLTFGIVGIQNIIAATDDPHEITRLHGKIDGLQMARRYVDEVFPDDC